MIWIALAVFVLAIVLIIKLVAGIIRFVLIALAVLILGGFLIFNDDDSPVPATTTTAPATTPTSTP